MFVKGQKGYDENMWMHQQGKPAHTTWLGLSFERLCFAHAAQIRRALGLDIIATRTYSLLTDKAQMDMVIERADGVVNLCEMKYTQQTYALDKTEAEKMAVRKDLLTMLNRKRQNVQCVLVTKQEAKHNNYYNAMIARNITMDDLMIE